MGGFIEKINKTVYRFIRGNRFLFYWFRLLKNTILGFGRDGGYHLSAGLAFFALFAAFPLLLLGISLIGYRLNQPQAIASVTDYLHRFIPSQADIILKNVQAIAHDRGKIGVIGLVILTWASRGLFLAMEHSVNRLWNVEAKRSFIVRNLLAFALILFLFVLVGISMMASTLIDYLTRLKVPLLNVSISQLSFYGLVNRVVFSTLFIFVIFLVLYKLLPHRKVSFAQVAPGALFATILWKTAEFGYIWYMSNVARMQEIYGSLGGLFGGLLWFYIGGIVFLLGAKYCVVRLRLLHQPPKE